MAIEKVEKVTRYPARLLRRWPEIRILISFNGDFVRLDFHDKLRESTGYVELRRRKLRARISYVRGREHVRNVPS